MKKNLSLLLSLATAAMLAGCSHTQEASNETFTKVLNTFLEQNPACLPVGHDVKLPIRVPLGSRQAAMKYGSRLNTLASLGLLSKVEAKGAVPEENFTGTYDQYDLTNEGKKYWKTTATGDGFCYARGVVKQVVFFTPPSQVDGHTVSTVQWSMVLADMAPWVNPPAIYWSYPGMPTSATQEYRLSAEMEQTDSGWVVKPNTIKG